MISLVGTLWIIRLMRCSSDGAATHGGVNFSEIKSTLVPCDPKKAQE